MDDNFRSEEASSRLPADLPGELKPYYVYDANLGKCVSAVPMPVLEEAEESGDLEMYEVSVPYRYLLSKDYAFYYDHVIADVKYDRFIGLVTPPEYYEY